MDTYKRVMAIVLILVLWVAWASLGAPATAQEAVTPGGGAQEAGLAPVRGGRLWFGASLMLLGVLMLYRGVTFTAPSV